MEIDIIEVSYFTIWFVFTFVSFSLFPSTSLYNSGFQTQLRLEAFYSFNERFAKIRSQRIKKAVKGITGSSELTGDIVQEGSESRKGKRTSRAKEPKHKNQLYGGTNNDCMEPLETSLSEDKAGESPIPGHGRVVAESGMTANIRGRGRGSVSKSGGGRGAKARGRSKLKKKTESFKGSSSDASDDADDAGGQNKKQNDTFGLRRVSSTAGFFLHAIMVVVTYYQMHMLFKVL